MQERGEKIHLLPLPLGWKSNEVGFGQSSPRNLGEFLFQNYPAGLSGKEDALPAMIFVLLLLLFRRSLNLRGKARRFI